MSALQEKRKKASAMFTDRAKIYIQSGKGGDGHVSFRRELFVPAGGPDGGDGGKGGDIIFEVSDGLNTLTDFRHIRKYIAESGQPGGKRRCHGADGRDLVIKVPEGTVIRDDESGKIIADMSGENRRLVVIRGGRGGIGNMHFATSTMQAPNYAKPGQPATGLFVRLELKGIGTNLTCFNFVHPDTEKLTQLADAARSLGADTYVSGGNSATLDLMLKGGIPAGVNLLRLGESLLFGRERAHYAYLPGTRNDAFILRAEIIELKEKPSMPWGTFGVDSYGRAPEHHDRGVRRRAICALGRQDADFETLWTVDPGVEILGASSDHLMVDVTDAEREYRMGDVIELRCGYYALLRAYNSDYVAKRYLR